MHFTNVKAGGEYSSLGFKRLIESCHDLCFSILSAVISTWVTFVGPFPIHAPLLPRIHAPLSSLVSPTGMIVFHVLSHLHAYIRKGVWNFSLLR